LKASRIDEEKMNVEKTRDGFGDFGRKTNGKGLRQRKSACGIRDLIQKKKKGRELKLKNWFPLLITTKGEIQTPTNWGGKEKAVEMAGLLKDFGFSNKKIQRVNAVNKRPIRCT